MGPVCVLGRLERRKKRARGERRRGEREPNLTFSLFPSIPARSLLFFIGSLCRDQFVRQYFVLSLQLAGLLAKQRWEIYIRDSDFKPSRLSYFNCATITSVFLSTIASHADVFNRFVTCSRPYRPEFSTDQRERKSLSYCKIRFRST